MFMRKNIIKKKKRSHKIDIINVFFRKIVISQSQKHILNPFNFRYYVFDFNEK